MGLAMSHYKTLQTVSQMVNYHIMNTEPRAL